MRIFGERHLSDYLHERHNALLSEVQAEDRNQLLNMNETEYVAYLVQRHQVGPLVLDWDGLKISDREEMIPAENFPDHSYVRSGRRYPKQVVTYHVPHSGERELLRCKPSSGLMWSQEVRLEGGCVCLDLVSWRDEPGEISSEANGILSRIRLQSENVDREVNEHNRMVETEVPRVVQERKAALLRQANLMASLGVPFRKADQVPATFAVPISARKVVAKPDAPNSAFKPEPAMESRDYGEILRIIHESGIAMEQHPAIYFDEEEETIRDYLLMVLSPNFQSVTGETFNRSGKTDILVRHEKSNLFVAECKFWKGKKGFFETIDQLLGYLTWRESKSAIVCFIRNQELNPVLQQIECETAQHPCFVKYHGKKSDSWFDFEFHLRGDSTRNVRLTVLCFHFPEHRAHLSGANSDDLAHPSPLEVHP